MVLIIRKFLQFIQHVHELRDPSMAKLFLMESTLPVLSICILYLLFVLKWGPAFMQNRQPYDLKKIIIIYNVVQIVLNFWNGLRALILVVWNLPYDFGCMLPVPLDTYLGQTEMHIIHNFFLLKILDLFDTVFFVLRKNYKQISFLHVYHHFAVVFCTYIALRWFRCGGHMSSLGILNMIVHGFMYTYYLLSAVDKSLIWWKKYVTLLQIGQFIFLISHNLWPLIMRPDCTYPRAVIIMLLLQSGLMLFLFSKFYYKTYIRKQKIQR